MAEPEKAQGPQDQTQEISTNHTQQLPRTIAVRHTRRVLVFVAGWAVLLLGIVLSLPGVIGPGFLVVIAGLTILATEFRWARKLLVNTKAKFREMRERRRRDQ